MSNENENENSSYSQHAFSISKPLDEKDKELILKKIHGSLRHVFKVIGMCYDIRPGDSEEDRIKRVLMFTSKVCDFTVDCLEKHGAVIVLDKQYAQAILTEALLPIPALVDDFGTDVLKEM